MVFTLIIVTSVGTLSSVYASQGEAHDMARALRATGVDAVVTAAVAS